MEKYTTSAILAIAATYFAVFSVCLLNSAAKIDSQMASFSGNDFSASSNVGAYVFAVVSAVLFVSAIVSAIKAK